MKIIIQAGGKGTRLEGLTKNKPKCLVSVQNLPMIFHIFKRYPLSEFIIIGDYKFDVLKKYLQIFAKDYNYKLIKANEVGNICGIKEALNYVNNDERFLLMWSDLIFSNDFLPEKLPSDQNYIGILEGSLCSWSYIGGVLDKIASDKFGVSGCFIFNKTKEFDTIPENGSFTTWLKNSNINLSPMSMKGCLEIGTLESIAKLKDTQNRCRPYNKMEFMGDKVIKTGLTDEGKKLIDREIIWYKKMVKYGFSSIPKIFDYEPLTMGKIDGTNIFQANLTQEQKENILDNLLNSVKKMQSYDVIPADIKDLKAEYYTKTIDRLKSIQSVIPFASDEYIKINGKNCKNPLLFLNDFENAVENKLYETEFRPIHGDCTLTNTMVDSENNIYFIDARGYFGSKEVFGDIRYDWAKLYYSISGNFDKFNVKEFELNILQDEINFKIASNGWESLENKLLNSTDCDIEEIKFIHSIIWLSLASHCWEDYDSMCLAFYNGVYLINEHI